MAMLQTLSGGEAKRAALLAAAAEALKTNRDDHNLFKVVLAVIAASRSRRNDFAHHLWGISREVPNALLLVDPKIWVKQSTMVEVHKRRDPKTLNINDPGPSRFIDHRKIWVFRKTALAQDVKEASSAAHYVLLLNYALDREQGGNEVADQARAMLLSAPRVRREFQRLTNESVKSTPPQRRPKKPSAKQRRIRGLAQKSSEHP